MGHAEHGRGRPRSRCCSPTATGTGCTSGTSTSARTCRRSTSAPSTRWCSSCAPRTIRPRHTASSASSSRRPTCPRPCGCGNAQDDGKFTVNKVITIPAEPADTDQLPPALQPFGAVPPLITDIALSVDDRDLYVSCWGTGELKRYDVSDPSSPRRPGRCGSAASSNAPRIRPAGPLNGGPQMVEVSRDGRRVYLTNSLYASWDAQFYPEGIDGWLVKLDSAPGRLVALDPTSSWSSAASGRTRCGSRAATRPPTRTASRHLSHERGLALGGDGAARRLSRAQPSDGLAVRSRRWAAGARPAGRAARAATDRDRARAGARGGRRDRAGARRRGVDPTCCTSSRRGH